MNRTEFLNDYWSYYLLLERKFINTLNYVELSPQNYKTYSNEFAFLMQSIGAELDSFFKIYCDFLPTDRKTISDYAATMLQKDIGITTETIIIMGKDITLTPFHNWNSATASQSLPWWQAFDKIKHSRVQNCSGASLKNCLNSLAALYLLETKYLIKITVGTDDFDIPDHSSELFIVKGLTHHCISMSTVFGVDSEVCSPI